MCKSKYGQIYSDQERKDLLFDVTNLMNNLSYGSACWGSLSLLHSIGIGEYFSCSKNTNLSKLIKNEDVELYSKLQVFYHQNTPEDDEC